MFARTVLAITALALSTNAQAGVAVDPAGDFLGSYTGEKGNDLDILSAQVTFDTSTQTFAFTTTTNAAIATTPGSFYVFGLNRGGGTARFGALAPGVLFDMVVVLRPDGTGTITNLTGGGAVQPFLATISGSTISAADLPAAFFPNSGLLATDYTFNVWSRVVNVVGNASIADFAPDNQNVGVTVVPTPGALGVLGLAGVVGLRRRR